jgi:hypothetical protein
LFSIKIDGAGLVKEYSGIRPLDPRIGTTKSIMTLTFRLGESRSIRGPLRASWSLQPASVWLADVQPGAPGVPRAPVRWSLDGRPLRHQFTGRRCPRRGAQVMLLLALEPDRPQVLACHLDSGSDHAPGLQCEEWPWSQAAVIGQGAIRLMIPPPAVIAESGALAGPFAGCGDQPMSAAITCDQPLRQATLARINQGPLFDEFELVYTFAQDRRYRLWFRFWLHESMVEVSERFALGMGAMLHWRLNPRRDFDTILSRDSFEGETQPALEPLRQQRVDDLLCRLQMPVLSEYFVPSNRGWFALLSAADAGRGMMGVLGLHGARWLEPVANMPHILGHDGAVQWTASLCSGSRHWLIYRGPVQTSFTPQRRLVFHRLHAQFNACRLDQHLDIEGQVHDRGFADRPCVLPPGDYHADARRRLEQYPCLGRALEHTGPWLAAGRELHLDSYRYLLQPTPPLAQRLRQHMQDRLDRWVRQFQGYRTGKSDYAKNVIGFSRCLRAILLAYEQLRRDRALSGEALSALNDGLVFAARRITDQGRWPHDRTWRHPDHPESCRDFYTYGGEHKPDRLVWSNSLPNFQSDPLCALAHLSSLLPEHPEAQDWLHLALDDLDRQLDAYCGRSGAWQESINYARYTFSYFLITFRALKARWAIDYFNDARVRRLASWLCRFWGPRDKRWGCHTWPGIGNAVLPQNQAELLLCYAAELNEADPLRDQCLAVWHTAAHDVRPDEHMPLLMAATAPLPAPLPRALPVRRSEVMDEVGVALRDRHGQPAESYLFQKIGFAKDHYEADETSFNWYAKGTPLCMDYGAYSGHVAVGGAHNLVEIPDEDNLRRGYLKQHLLTSVVDFTHCECPVTLKLLWGRPRNFAEIQSTDGKTDHALPPYFYIGDRNPTGPKAWKVRLLLFVKPDYLAIFDRVYGEVSHRYNLHVTGHDLSIMDGLLRARGDFDLDLLGLVQHPSALACECETGRLVPNVHGGEPAEREKHAQSFWRLYNRQDGMYRTLLFAQERGRDVTLEPIGRHGMMVRTEQYTDLIFLHNDWIEEQFESDAVEQVRFRGRSGWIRRTPDGLVQAMMIDGSHLQAFGLSIDGRGPWSLGLDGNGVTLLDGPPRRVSPAVVHA